MAREDAPAAATARASPRWPPSPSPSPPPPSPRPRRARARASARAPAPRHPRLPPWPRRRPRRGRRGRVPAARPLAGTTSVNTRSASRTSVPLPPPPRSGCRSRAVASGPRGGGGVRRPPSASDEGFLRGGAPFLQLNENDERGRGNWNWTCLALPPRAYRIRTRAGFASASALASRRAFSRVRSDLGPRAGIEFHARTHATRARRRGGARRRAQRCCAAPPEDACERTDRS